VSRHLRTLLQQIAEERRQLDREATREPPSRHPPSPELLDDPALRLLEPHRRGPTERSRLASPAAAFVAGAETRAAEVESLEALVRALTRERDQLLAELNGYRVADGLTPRVGVPRG
jgi:hypothetical protein